MKKLSLSLLIVTASFVLAACSSSTPAPKAGDTQTGVEEKKGDTTKKGIISEAGGKFYITETGKPAAEIDSMAVELKEYVGKKVSVTGQYSGDTLFVAKVE